jgi:Uncharacterized conserved protein
MLTVEELLGKTVIGAAGNYIGEVSNLNIDSRTWQVTHLHVKLSDKAAREFGVKKALKASNIRLPVNFVRDVDIIIRLNQSLIDIKNCLSQPDCMASILLT